MPKIRKQHRKKRFRANVNRKRLRNKLQKVPKIECEEIDNSWESKRSIRTNLKDMGLAYDPNEALKIPSIKREISKAIGLRKNGIEDEENNSNNGTTGDEDIPETDVIESEKIHVAKKLEADAKAPRERMFRLPKSQVHFVTYLMEKYGEDYKAMARDRKNHYQMTWCQIRAKINTFKSVPEQYAEYLIKSGEIVLDDPTPLEETRRKIGEENVKKYCVARKRKLPKEPRKSLWEVESENEEFCSDNREGLAGGDSEQGNEGGKNKDSGLKKLKLFSDDESSDEESKSRGKMKRIFSAEENGDKKLGEKESDGKIKGNSGSVKRKESGDINLGKNDNLKKDLTSNLKTVRKKVEKSQSSDSDSDDEELDGDQDAEGFMDLSDMSEEELSEDDVLDDGEFVTDSDEDSN